MPSLVWALRSWDEFFGYVLRINSIGDQEDAISLYLEDLSFISLPDMTQGLPYQLDLATFWFRQISNFSRL